MKTVNIPVSTIEILIEGLESALNVCYNVKSCIHEDSEKTYPYATGYSKSTMQQTIKTLEVLKTQAN